MLFRTNIVVRGLDELRSHGYIRKTIPAIPSKILLFQLSAAMKLSNLFHQTKHFRPRWFHGLIRLTRLPIWQEYGTIYHLDVNTTYRNYFIHNCIFRVCFPDAVHGSCCNFIRSYANNEPWMWNIPIFWMPRCFADSPVKSDETGLWLYASQAQDNGPEIGINGENMYTKFAVQSETKCTDSSSTLTSFFVEIRLWISKSLRK